LLRDCWFNWICVSSGATALVLCLTANPVWSEDRPMVSPDSPSAVDPVGKETIVIRADQAWEEPDTEQVLHFKGDFELISPDWELRSDEADLYGPLDDPDRIVARGLPAVVTILTDSETVVGEGRTIEYQREPEILTLTDQARIIGEKISMKSAEIVYDVGREQLKSGGSDGVEMVLERAVR